MSASGPTDYSATPTPPAGEEVHLPGPTILPLVAAIAITLIVIGTTIDWIFSAVGGVVLPVALVPLRRAVELGKRHDGRPEPEMSGEAGEVERGVSHPDILPRRRTP